MDANDYLPEEAHDYGPITFNPDPIYADTGEEIRIDGRLVGRIRRHTSGAYAGTATISGLSVVGNLAPTGPGAQSMWRKTTHSDAVRAILKQAFQDLASERRGQL